MKKKQKILFKAIICFAIITICVHISHMYVFAKDINANEQQLINALSEIFEFDGKTYKVDSALITEARNFLLSEEIDLTKEQTEELLQYMRSNLQTAVYEGYLILIETPEALSDEETNLSNEATSDNEGTSDKEDKNSNEGMNVNNNNIVDDDTKGYIEENYNTIIGQGESNSDNESDISNNNTQESSALNETNNEQHPNITNEAENEQHPNMTNEAENEQHPNMTNEANDEQHPDITNQTNDTQNQDIIIKTEKANDIMNQDATTKAIDMQEQNKAEKQTSQLIDESDNNSIFNANKIIIYICIIVITLAVITVIIRRLYITSQIAKSNQKQERSKGYIDIHAHILPGVDDGPRNMKETVEMLKLAYEQGIRTIIATPHYHVNRKTTPARLKEIADEVQKEAIKIDKDFRILLGNEIFFEDGCLEALKLNKACTMAGSRYILVEFSLDEDFQRMYNGMRDLIQEGYCPIIAHAERYQCFYKKKERILSLIEAGCYIQVNADSMHKMVRKMIAENLVHFIASDCHDIYKRKPNMENSLRILRKTMDESAISRMVISNPSKMIEKIYI